MPLADYSLDEALFDPAGFVPAYTQPTTNYSNTSSFNGNYAPTNDWFSFATGALKLLPNILSAGAGHGYGSTPYGQQSAPYAGGPVAGGQGLYAGGSLLGASGFGNISGTTLILLGVVAFMLLRRK